MIGCDIHKKYLEIAIYAKSVSATYVNYDTTYQQHGFA